MFMVQVVNPFRDFSRAFATQRAALLYATRMAAAGYMVAGFTYTGGIQ